MITRSLFLTLGMCITALAQTTQPGDLVTRVYDIRDMLITIPNFPYEGALGLPVNFGGGGGGRDGGGGGGGGGQALFGGQGGIAQAAADGKAHQQRVDEIIKLIRETVDSASWRDAGGKSGSMQELDGQLVVTQTPQGQQQVGALLNQLRGRFGLVRVQADWVMLTPDQMKTLLAPAKGGDAPKIVDRDALTKLAAEVPHYRGEISCFDGQTVSINSGRSRSVVYDGEPVVAQNAVAVNPDIRQVESGAMLEVTPVVLTDADAAIVQVRSAVAEWSKPEKAELTYSSTQPGGSNVQGPSSIDCLNVLRQELKSALRIPLNQPVLVGGMTLEPTVETPQGSQLYLILQVSASR